MDSAGEDVDSTGLRKNSSRCRIGRVDESTTQAPAHSDGQGHFKKCSKQTLSKEVLETLDKEQPMKTISDAKSAEETEPGIIHVPSTPKRSSKTSISPEMSGTPKKVAKMLPPKIKQNTTEPVSTTEMSGGISVSSNRSISEESREHYTGQSSRPEYLDENKDPATETGTSNSRSIGNDNGSIGQATAQFDSEGDLEKYTKPCPSAEMSQIPGKDQSVMKIEDLKVTGGSVLGIEQTPSTSKRVAKTSISPKITGARKKIARVLPRDVHRATELGSGDGNTTEVPEDVLASHSLGDSRVKTGHRGRESSLIRYSLSDEECIAEIIETMSMRLKSKEFEPPQECSGASSSHAGRSESAPQSRRLNCIFQSLFQRPGFQHSVNLGASTSGASSSHAGGSQSISELYPVNNIWQELDQLKGFRHSVNLGASASGASSSYAGGSQSVPQSRRLNNISQALYQRTGFQHSVNLGASTSGASSSYAGGSRSASQSHSLSNISQTLHQRTGFRSTTNLADTNCPEKIIICLDYIKDAAPSKDCGRIMTLYELLNAVESFIRIKSRIDKRHEFAIVTFVNTFSIILNYTNDYKRCVAKIYEFYNSIFGRDDNWVVVKGCDLAGFFESVINKSLLPDILPATEDTCPPFIVRLVIIYRRSNMEPIFGGKLDHCIRLLQSPYVFVDVLYIHDGRKQSQKISSKWRQFCNERSYVFDVRRGDKTAITASLMKLSAHALQRPQQNRVGSNLQEVVQ